MAGWCSGLRWPTGQHLDLPNLHITFVVNGETVLERKGGHPTDDPLAAAIALANMWRDAGELESRAYRHDRQLDRHAVPEAR